MAGVAFLAGAAFFTAALVEAPLVAAAVRTGAAFAGASVVWSSIAALAVALPADAMGVLLVWNFSAIVVLTYLGRYLCCQCGSWRKKTPALIGRNLEKGPMQPYTPPPAEAFVRNGELRLAAVIVALVVVPGAMKKISRSAGAPPECQTRQGIGGRAKRSHVRAPRAC